MGFEMGEDFLKPWWWPWMRTTLPVFLLPTLSFLTPIVGFPSPADFIQDYKRPFDLFSVPPANKLFNNTSPYPLICRTFICNFQSSFYLLHINETCSIHSLPYSWTTSCLNFSWIRFCHIITLCCILKMFSSCTSSKSPFLFPLTC